MKCYSLYHFGSICKIEENILLISGKRQKNTPESRAFEGEFLVPKFGEICKLLRAEQPKGGEHGLFPGIVAQRIEPAAPTPAITGFPVTLSRTWEVHWIASRA